MKNSSTAAVSGKQEPVTGQAIVCVGFNDWESDLWTNQHHLMARLAAADNRILFVESLGLRRPSIARRDLRRMARRLHRAFGGPRRLDGVHVLSPLVVPAHGIRVARELNARLLPMMVGRATQRLGLAHPILWSYLPQAEVLLAPLRPSRVIYHCVDDVAAHPRIDSASFRRAEARFAAAADAILCSAPPLAERMRTLAPPERVHLMPNVADTERFGQAMAEGPVDAELAALPQPRLVFTGAITAVKVNFRLLRDLSRRRRDWTIALVGPVGLGDPTTDVRELAAEPNVHILGTRRYDDLPAVLRGAAVGLIPYHRNALTGSIFPMKVYEYLAAGLPVVATPLPSLVGVQGIALAEGPDGFAAAIGRAIAEDSPQRRQQRSRVAATHSWEARLREIDEVLSACA